MEPYEVFAFKAKQMMKKRNLSYRELGKQIGYSHTTLWNHLELRPAKHMPLPMALKIAHYFGKTIDEMLELKTDEIELKEM